MNTNQQAIVATECWLRQFVLKHGLCPFAGPVVERGNYTIHVCTASDVKELSRAVLMALDALQSASEQVLATSLLVFTGALHDFDDYLAFVDHAQQLLAAAGLEGEIQLATFHPDYCFAGESEQAASHYTNRAPFPTLHFIREAQLERLRVGDDDSARIVAQNIDTMARIGVAQLQQQLKQLRSEPPSAS